MRWLNVARDMDEGPRDVLIVNGHVRIPRAELDVKAMRKTRLLGLPELRAIPELADMAVLRRGNRLSITPVDPAHWGLIVEDLLKAGSRMA